MKSTENEEGTKYHCKIGNCNKRYGVQSDAIRHIRINHKVIHQAINANKTKKKDLQSDGGIGIEIRVKIDPELIWNCCVELVTVNGLPLRAIEYPALQRILHPYVISLQRQGIDLRINRQNIKDRINEKVTQIKKNDNITSEKQYDLFNDRYCIKIQPFCAWNEYFIHVQW